MISFASNQRSARSRSLGGVVEAHTPEAQFETPYGPLYPLSYYAMAAQRYLHTYGGTREQLAEIAVAAREWALLNPAAFRYGAGPLTVDDVLGVADDLQPADRRGLLPGHRRRRRGRAHLGGARPRPAPQARSRCSGTASATTNTSMTAVRRPDRAPARSAPAPTRSPGPG